MGQIADKAADAYRDYNTAGVPASGPFNPEKVDIRLLFKIVDVAIAAVNAGIAIVSTTAQRDTFYATEANRGKLVYVNNNNGSATDPANGVYEYVNGAPRIAQSFYAGLATVVQPLVDDARDAANRAEAAAASIQGSLSSINGQLAELKARIEQVAASVPIPGTFRAQDVFINNTGQSLGEGSNGALTTTQQSNSVGFAWRAENPVAYLPLTIANTQAVNPAVGAPAGPNRGESPMYGAARHINEIKNARNFPSQAATDLRLVMTNNAVSSQGIDYFEKGTANYAAAMSQVTAGKNISAAAGRTFKYGATFWTQGENQLPTAAEMRDRLIQLASNINTDTKAITGQTEDSLLICYQTPSATPPTSALGQLQAHIASPLVVMATPIYQLDYYDSRHITAASSQILGAYYGYVYWWQEIARRTWEPTRPRAVRRVSAKVIEVDYYTMGGALAFDTTIMPAQANMGFLLVDANDNIGPFGALTVEIVGEKTVRITVAGTIPDGSMVTYGRIGIVGKPNLNGFGGNLRDSAGGALKYDVKDGSGNVVVSQYPMHNWAVLSSDPIPTS